jgi:hypothetical protein
MHTMADFVVDAHQRELLRAGRAARPAGGPPDRPGIIQRLDARLRAGHHDRRIAAGAAPVTGATAVRAARLAAPRTRSRLGRRLLEIVSDARTGYPSGAVLGFRVPLLAPEVIAAADVIERLGRRLYLAEPVNPRGVARALLLITDGAGPFYHRAGGRDLRTEVGEALDGLRPTPQR